MISEKAKPKGFLKRLKIFDPYLDLEYMPDSNVAGHWCIIDMAKLVAVFPRKTTPCITQFKKVFNRIYHVPSRQRLDDTVIKELRERRLQNWQTEKAYKQDYQQQVDAGEDRKAKDEFNQAQNLSTNPADLKRFGVVMPGFKRMPLHTGKRSIYGS